MRTIVTLTAVDPLLELFDRQVRQARHPRASGVRTEVEEHVIRTVGLDHGGWFSVNWSKLDENNADEVIQDQIDYFGALGEEFEWKYFDYDQPVDLEKRLLRFGFSKQEDESVMVGEIDRIPTSPPAEGFQLIEATTTEGIDDLVSVHEKVFDANQDRFAEQLKYQLAHAPQSLICLVAYAEGIPVAASRIDFGENTEFASLWGGGTLEEFRGRGIYRAMVAHRAARAAERGYRYLYVDASNQSRPILERLGFRKLARTTPYTH